jgi:hypothetical protein
LSVLIAAGIVAGCLFVCIVYLLAKREKKRTKDAASAESDGKDANRPSNLCSTRQNISNEKEVKPTIGQKLKSDMMSVFNINIFSLSKEGHDSPKSPCNPCDEMCENFNDPVRSSAYRDLESGAFESPAEQTLKSHAPRRARADTNDIPLHSLPSSSSSTPCVHPMSHGFRLAGLAVGPSIHKTPKGDSEGIAECSNVSKFDREDSHRTRTPVHSDPNSLDPSPIFREELMMYDINPINSKGPRLHLPIRLYDGYHSNEFFEGTNPLSKWKPRTPETESEATSMSETYSPPLDPGRKGYRSVE